MENKTRRPKFLVLLLFLVFAVAGCQYKPKSENTTDFSSRLPVPSKESDQPKDLALCNGLPTEVFTAQTMIFLDPNKTYSPNYLRLHLSEVFADFEDAQTQIVLRKWKASATGETYQSDTPLRLRVERKGTHAPLTNYRSLIQWDILKNDLQGQFTPGTTMKDIFDQINFVVELNDPDGSYDALKISIYQSGEWVQDFNLLIPAFYANPAKFAEGHPLVLERLHPLYDAPSTTFAVDFFKAFCFE